MIVVGFDPGTQRTGYAVLEISASIPRLLELGIWDLMGSSRAAPPLGTRLEQLFDEASRFVERWNPARIGLERAVTFRNPLSALKLSEARGIVRLAAHRVLASAEERIIEISPTRVKKHATALGMAGKQDVQRVLALRFGNLGVLAEGKELAADAFDALAVAWSAWVESRSRNLDPRRKSGEVST